MSHLRAPTEAPTEQRNPATHDLDRLSSLELLQVINAEDSTVAAAVAHALPALAAVVDEAARRLQRGGRVHYFGAGTSGRLAMLDAVELEPTYSLEPGRFVAHQAGGAPALTRAIEGAEDGRETGMAAAGGTGPDDVAVGLAASGATPFVHGALIEARRRGAYTALVSAHPSAPIAADVDVHVLAPTGPEVVAGSTRMKAGTAQKLVLNAFSTAVMVRLGKTYSNLMVDVAATNDKLRRRMITILMEATGQPADRCRAALTAAEGELKVALVMLLAEVDAGTAATALDAGGGVVRRALTEIDDRETPPGSVPRRTERVDQEENR